MYLYHSALSFSNPDTVRGSWGAMLSVKPPSQALTKHLHASISEEPPKEELEARSTRGNKTGEIECLPRHTAQKGWT